MFLVSNFPQVPIATTNPATEGAAREQQLRQPLPAPEALAKAAAERSLDTERDKAEELKRKDSKQQQHQDSSEQQEEPESGQPGYSKQSLKSLLAQANPTIERPGKPRHRNSTIDANTAKLIDDADYGRFAEVIAKVYHSSGLPEQPSRLLAST